jgi:hypothetical protein
VYITDDDMLSLILENGDAKEDLKVPDDASGEKIRETLALADEKGQDCMVTVLSAIGASTIS